MDGFSPISALSGVLLGVLLAGAGCFLLLRALSFQYERKPLHLLPCIGQHWHLRGVGPVQITGLQLHDDSGEIYAVRYVYRVAGQVLFEGRAPLKAFLRSAVLIEPPAASYRALPSPASNEVH